MTSPIHRVNASADIFKDEQILFDEDEERFQEMVDEIKNIYKNNIFISTSLICQKLKVNHSMALKIMSHVIRELH